MISAKIKNLDSVFTRIQRELGRVGNRVTQALYEEAVKATPKDKGKARRGWHIRKGTNPTESTAIQKETKIVNRTPYIGRLEKGHSKQAPRGILKPTLEAFKRRGKI